MEFDKSGHKASYKHGHLPRLTRSEATSNSSRAYLDEQDEPLAIRRVAFFVPVVDENSQWSSTRAATGEGSEQNQRPRLTRSEATSNSYRAYLDEQDEPLAIRRVAFFVPVVDEKSQWSSTRAATKPPTSTAIFHD